MIIGEKMNLKEIEIWYRYQTRSANSRRFFFDFSRVKLVRKLFRLFHRLKKKSSTIFIFEND